MCLTDLDSHLRRLADFEDTFHEGWESCHTSAAPTARTFKDSNFSSVESHETNSGEEETIDVPDDLQDLIDSVMTTDEDTTFSALSEVSSFEGNASTAHEAIAMVTEHPSMPENAMASIASAVRPSIDNETDRPSLDTERPSRRLNALRWIRGDQASTAAGHRSMTERSNSSRHLRTLLSSRRSPSTATAGTSVLQVAQATGPVSATISVWSDLE